MIPLPVRTLAFSLPLAFALLYPRTGECQAIHSLIATDYFVDYSRHAHAYAEDIALVPRFQDANAWARIREVLMHGRRAHALYLVGDDRIHLFPTRVGILGWGMNAGLEF